MNHTIASTKMAAMVLTVSNANTDGPGSALRASCAVSTMRPPAFTAAAFDFGRRAVVFETAALVAISPSLHCARISAVSGVNARSRMKFLRRGDRDAVRRKYRACRKPTAGASRCQGLFS